jgi:FSR family fosmidomycin resistance protein-like MFS transporter
MDLDPDRHEQNMMRWVLVGSVGVVAGSLALGAAAALGLGWRGLYAVFAGLEKAQPERLNSEYRLTASA